MAKNKLEELRKSGNFTPQEPFSGKSADNRSNITFHKKETDTSKYIPSANQRRTLKVSNQTNKEITELKRHLKLRYVYEVVQFLIDDYVKDHFSVSEKKRFEDNTK